MKHLITTTQFHFLAQSRNGNKNDQEAHDDGSNVNKNVISALHAIFVATGKEMGRKSQYNRQSHYCHGIIIDTIIRSNNKYTPFFSPMQTPIQTLP